MRDIFRIHRNELLPALSIAIVLAIFNILIIQKFLPIYSDWMGELSWHLFMNNYHMAGFDPYIYSIVSEWSLLYDVIRHPLLAWMLWPLFIVNQVLSDITGVNCVQFVVGALLYFCAFYSFVFLYRILCNVVPKGDGTDAEGKQPNVVAWMLSLMFFGFAYVLVSTIVADHFCLSLFGIMLTLYLSDRKLRQGCSFSVWETLSLFVPVAGVTLSNGVIVLIAVFVVNGSVGFGGCLFDIRRNPFFRLRFLLPAVVLPSLVLIAIGPCVNAVRYSVNSVTVNPVEFQMRDVKQEMPFVWTLTTPEGEFSGISLAETRLDAVMENMFGESLQLHRKHLLGDVLVKRPVFVRYTYAVQYAVEAILVAMLFAGIWVARRKRLMCVVVLIFLFNIALHIVLGFAANEVSIMACHWAFILPLSFGYLVDSLRQRRKCQQYVLATLAVITLYIYVYHGYLLYNYLTWPLAGTIIHS